LTLAARQSVEYEMNREEREALQMLEVIKTK
jgi:hypothetical protein